MDCPKGFYCNDSVVVGIPLGIIEPRDCTAGNWCGLNSTGETACGAGFYGPLKNLWDISQCVECPPGKFCTGGLDSPDGLCDAGYKCDGQNSTANSDPCTAGNVCA